MSAYAARSVWLPYTVYYNASSPQFAREVEALKNLDHGGRLVFVDCSAADFDETVLAGTWLRRSHLMSNIYVRDAHGSWRTGIVALEAAYRAAY